MQTLQISLIPCVSLTAEKNVFLAALCHSFRKFGEGTCYDRQSRFRTQPDRVLVPFAPAFAKRRIIYRSRNDVESSRF